MDINQNYVWYACYGSNLSEQRFLCYIKGGKPKYGKKSNKGCTNKTLPLENKPIKIPYSLYFALPEGKQETLNWGKGGVAFITPKKVREKNMWTLGRMWKILREQYEEVKKQEGPLWYGYEIYLGEDDGVPIYTITNECKLGNVIPPSESYLKTIILGLKETYNLKNEEIYEYLIEREGVKGNFLRDNLIKIIETVD